MNRITVVSALAWCGLTGVAAAQRVSIGLHGALGDYREVSQDLHYRGTGGGAALWVSYHKFSAEGSFTRVSYDPKKGGFQSFKATQLDARVGYAVAAGVTAEVGVIKRTVDPALSAQEMGAGRIGVRYVRQIGPGTTVGLRGNYLPGAKFTGQGSAGLAFELGLLLSAGPTNGRYRFTGDYGFQRVDRKVNGFKAPLEQSLVRIGVAVGF